MSHAERCPVCYGSGELPEKNRLSETKPTICHGCGGSGWVTVQDTPSHPWGPPHRVPRQQTELEKMLQDAVKPPADSMRFIQQTHLVRNDHGGVVQC